ncbi:MAG: hypothetical protein QNK29_00195, partial [Desulfobacterales bacterium]|nr:hypothetical protein [Desulfobacterales bacterium]MDX2510452.1 hypothetical protein [Desulfobacterales bacterium]
APGPVPTAAILKQIASRESTNSDGTVNACLHSIAGPTGKHVRTNTPSTIQPTASMPGSLTTFVYRGDGPRTSVPDGDPRPTSWTVACK